MAEHDRQTIVVGYDGSEAARVAVDYAVQKAGKEGLVVVVHAFGPPPDWLGAPNFARALEDHRVLGQAVLDGLLLEGSDALLETNHETELVDGSPAEAIVLVAQERNATEIVVGSRGFGSLRSALGSVSQGVLHLADRPVVVLPHSYIDTLPARPATSSPPHD